MLAMMLAGMFVTAYVFVAALGLGSWEATIVTYPTAALLVMAAGMSIPMAVWMLARRMGSRNTAEMTAAMVLPVLPFCALVWLRVTQEPMCGAYCALSAVAMLGLMLFRRDIYSMHM
jgi:hypothetical protein